MDMTERFLMEQSPQYDNFFGSLMSGQMPQRTDVAQKQRQEAVAPPPPPQQETRVPIGYGPEMGPPGSGAPQYADPQPQQNAVPDITNPQIQQQAAAESPELFELGSQAQKAIQANPQQAPQIKQQVVQQAQKYLMDTERPEDSEYNLFERILYSPSSINARHSERADEQTAWDEKNRRYDLANSLPANSPYAEGIAQGNSAAESAYYNSLKQGGLTFDQYQKLTPDQKAQYSKFKGWKDGPSTVVENNINNKLRSVDKQVEYDDRIAAAKNSREYVTGMVKSSVGARQEMAKTNRMLELIDSGTKTGYGQKWIVDAKRMMQTAGMDVKTANSGELQVLMGDLVMKRVAETKGAVSDREMRLFEEYSANFGKSPGGNKAIIGFYKKGITRQKKMGDMARAMRRKGVRDAQIENSLLEYQDANPISIGAPKQGSLPGGIMTKEEWEAAGMPGG